MNVTVYLGNLALLGSPRKYPESVEIRIQIQLVIKVISVTVNSSSVKRIPVGKHLAHLSGCNRYILKFSEDISELEPYELHSLFVDHAQYVFFFHCSLLPEFLLKKAS